MTHALIRDPQAVALMRLDRAALPQYLNRAQIQELVEACRDYHHGRDRLFVRVAFETGGRVTELVGIRRSDVDITNRQIRLRTLKRRLDRRRKIQHAARWIPVSHSLCADLGVYFLAMTGEVFHVDEQLRKAGRAQDADTCIDFPLFPFTRKAAYKLVTKAAKRAKVIARGGRDVSPHILRHSFAMNCLTQGVPITVVKELLGHASISSTMVYLKTDPAQAREFLAKVQF